MDYPVKDSAFGLQLLVLSAVQFMAVLDGTVVTLALPKMQESLGLSEVQRTWVITAYALAFGGLLLLGGRIGDTFGRRRVLTVGIALFTGASLACGLALNEPMLLIARVIQGAGAAIATPAAMALLVVTFAPGKVRNQAFSVFAMMTGLGSICGLLLGGALTEVSWRWIFLINVPVGVLLVVGALRSLHDSRGSQRLPLDIRGAVLATLGCTLVVFGLMTGGGNWGSPTVWIPLAFGVTVLGVFFVAQRTTTYPVLPLSLFRPSARAATFVALFFSGAVIMPVTVFLGLFVQEVLGYSPLRAGLAFIPFAIGMGIGSAMASQLSLKIPPRALIVLGGFLLLAGFAYGLGMDNTARFWPDIIIAELLISIGITVVIIPLTLSVVAGVKPNDVGPLTATALVAQTLGGPIGLALAGAVAESRTKALGGIVNVAREIMTTDEINKLGQGYLFSLTASTALILAIMIIALVWIRFSVADVEEGKQAEETAQSLDT